MEVILLEKVTNLGNLGDTVNVKPGFARNFLVPKGAALPATKANREQFEARRAELEAREKENRVAAEARRDRLVEIDTIAISAHAGTEGKLFGSVGSGDIAAAIIAAGVEVHRHEVRLDQGAFREVGDYEVVIHLHPEVETTVAIAVVPTE